jgi:hypothetical protein
LTGPERNFTLYSVNESAPEFERLMVAAFEEEPTIRQCQCERPIPRERAEVKWAARTYCDRCGLEMPLRWLGG